MRAVKVIVFLAAAIHILLGILLVIASGSPTAQTNSLSTGLICLAVGAALIWCASKFKSALPTSAEDAQKPHLKVGMKALKVIEFLAGAALILWGTLSIIASAGSEAQTNWLASGLIFLAIGVALVWRAGRLKPALPRPAEEAPDAIQLPKVRRRQSKGRRGLSIAIFLTLLSIVICVSCIGLLVKAFQPVVADYALCYPSASVVVTECIGPWEPVQGMDSVLELYHSSTAPIPDAMYAYAFFLEVRPDLVQEGRELLIPSDGVRPSLLEVHAPMCIHSTTLKGRLAILRVEETALTAWLDIQGEGEVSDWKYTGEVTFKNAIPRQASGSTPTRSP